MALPCVYSIALSSSRCLGTGLAKRVFTTCSKSQAHLAVRHGQTRWLSSPFRQIQGFRQIRGFRSRKDIVHPEAVEPAGPSLLRPLAFTVGVCSCSFLGAMIWNYEKMREAFQRLKKGIPKDSDTTQASHEKQFGFRQHLNSMWSHMSNGQKVVMGILAANVVVWGLWRVPGLQSTFVRYFSSSISHPLPCMVLSSFSHISFLHLFVNMYVLWSFASVAATVYGPEQFSAVYLSAGTVSAFTSIAANKLLKRPSTISVGASGAIMALLGIVCMTYPNAQLSIAFVSSIFPHSFSADTGMKAIIAFDTIGLLMGWRFLDHAGHLGGMLFGILYAKYGHKLIWGNREYFMKKWHEIRGKP